MERKHIQITEETAMKIVMWFYNKGPDVKNDKKGEKS